MEQQVYSENVTVSVGVKELRENLAEWLDRAHAGEEILVTERGRPKARLVPATAATTLEELARAGIVRLATRPLVLPAPLAVEGNPVTDILLEQRERS